MARNAKKRGDGAVDHTSFASSTEAATVQQYMDRVRSQAAGNSAQNTSRQDRPALFNIVRAIHVPDVAARKALLTRIGDIAVAAGTASQLRLWQADQLFVPLLSKDTMIKIANEAARRKIGVAGLLSRVIGVARQDMAPACEGTIAGDLHLRNQHFVSLPFASTDIVGDACLLAEVVKTEVTKKGASYNQEPNKFLTTGSLEKPLSISFVNGLRAINLPQWTTGASITFGGPQVVNLNALYEQPTYGSTL
ncbi:MAG TPA: hypothetical protein VLE73_04000 [Candidatus Saccharimonadales bacterium]|nr:hypothetical protein [Candidatus Saccharimonadales bacterium]